MEHDHYRNRLDMYAVLAVVSAALAVVAPAILIPSNGREWAGATASAGYLVLANISYRAAVSSGRGYAVALRAIDELLAR